MPPSGRAHWAVWEATVNSCWEGGLFIVSSQAQRFRQAWSPAHTPAVAGNCCRHRIQLQRSAGSLLREDSAHQETHEAPRTAGEIPTNRKLPIANCSIQCLVQEPKPKNPDPAANPTLGLRVSALCSAPNTYGAPTAAEAWDWVQQ